MQKILLVFVVLFLTANMSGSTYYQLINDDIGTDSTQVNAENPEENDALPSVTEQPLSIPLDTLNSLVVNPDLSSRIYPNPTKGIFSIELISREQKNLNVEVYNSNGLKIYTDKIDVDGRYYNTVNLMRFSEGLYLIKLHNKNVSITQKLLISNR